MKREKMNRRKREKDFGTINAWLEHKAKQQREKKEKSRKRAAEKLNSEFKIDFWGLV